MTHAKGTKMAEGLNNINENQWPNLAQLPLPIKVLASAVLMVMALGMTGAMGQIIVHDIIPTFFSEEAAANRHMEKTGMTSMGAKGDLFSDLADTPVPEKKIPKVDREQFVWLLKWTHIHLFGMNIIFILLGGVTVFLNLDTNLRAWLVALPFIGVIIDIAAMWLKAYVSPVFFWLHLPGGGLFGAVFLFVFVRGMREMWGGDQNG